MARLLVDTEWYEGLDSSAHYEFEFEELVGQHGDRLFPGWRLVSFKVDVESDLGRRRPDFALVDEFYRAWWVVEVELSHHSLDGHVLPQVETFCAGRYTASHAHHLAKKSGLDRHKLAEMLRGEQPRVLVIVDRPCPNWVRPLARCGAVLSVVEVFRSSRNRFCLRIDGHQPRLPTGDVTLLRRHRLLPRTMVVASPAALGGMAGQLFDIDCDGTVTEWVRVDLENEVLLRARRADPLLGSTCVTVVALRDGRLAFAERR